MLSLLRLWQRGERSSGSSNVHRHEKRGGLKLVEIHSSVKVSCFPSFTSFRQVSLNLAMVLRWIFPFLISHQFRIEDLCLKDGELTVN
jgi:hypothetical protein